MPEPVMNMSIISATPEAEAMVAKLRPHENLGDRIVVRSEQRLIFADLGTNYPLQFYIDFPGACDPHAVETIRDGLTSAVRWLHDHQLHCGSLSPDTVRVERNYRPLLTRYCRNVPADLAAAQKADLDALDELLRQLAAIEEHHKLDEPEPKKTVRFSSEIEIAASENATDTSTSTLEIRQIQAKETKGDSWEGDEDVTLLYD